MMVWHNALLALRLIRFIKAWRMRFSQLNTEALVVDVHHFIFYLDDLIFVIGKFFLDEIEEPFFNLVAGILQGLSIEVGRGAGCRRRCIWQPGLCWCFPA